MSVERVSPGGAPRPMDGSSASGAAEEKRVPSSFDRVMDGKREGEATRERPDAGRKKGEPDSREPARRESKLHAGSTDPAAPGDLSALLHLRTRTFERVAPAPPSGRVEAGLPRQLVDEVVQAVRVGVNRAGDREVQMDLRSDVLNGARIQISLHEGKVMATLQVTSHDLKNQIEAHLGELQQSMQGRGLDVARLHVEVREEPRPGRDQSQQGRDDRPDDQPAEESDR